MKKWIVPGFLALLIGCTGAPVRDGPATASPTEKPVELKADNYSFTPAHLSVPAGRPVVIRIHDESKFIPHSFSRVPTER